MAIVPDTKNWTWVLERRCPECGFDSSKVPTDQIAALIRANAGTWLAILAEDPEPLEYSCHVRDVFHVMDERLNLMIRLDDPTYQNWDQDRAAVEDHYAAQQPETVAADLSRAANKLASDFEGVDAAGWRRRGRRSDGATFTIETLGQYALHDVVHHLEEVTGDLAMPVS
jgi:hypothetical protein